MKNKSWCRFPFLIWLTGWIEFATSYYTQNFITNFFLALTEFELLFLITCQIFPSFIKIQIVVIRIKIYSSAISNRFTYMLVQSTIFPIPASILAHRSIQSVWFHINTDLSHSWNTIRKWYILCATSLSKISINNIILSYKIVYVKEKQVTPLLYIIIFNQLY